MSGPDSFSSMALPSLGAVIDGKYVLESELGRGGMGAVFKAKHKKLGHHVAIKVMLADAANHEAITRFVQEGRAAAGIQNEHVVRVSDVDEENGYAYMVLELLDGHDLAQVLEQQGRLVPHVAVGYVIQALDGLREAHAQHIVHRDLKPSNLFLAKRPNGSTVVKVLDFGISKDRSDPLGAAPRAQTSTKAMLGSPLYMSPEQLRSSKSVDARADIWAIGVILYELISGKLPFMGDNLGELFAQILEVEAAPLRTHVPDVPPQLEAIVARCLQRRADDRFQSVAELELELAPFASSSSTSPFAASAVASSAMAPHTAMLDSAPLAQVRAAQAHAQSSGQHGLAQTPSGMHAPPGMMAQTPSGMGHGPPPGTYPGPPRPGSMPGSVTGPGAPFLGGGGQGVRETAVLGANTPPPHAQTDSAWQNTGSSSFASSGLPKPPMLLIAGGLGLLVLVGVAIGGYALTRAKPSVSSGLQASASAGVASAEITPPPIAAAPTAATVTAPTAPVSDAGTSLASGGAVVPPVTAAPASTRHHPSGTAPVVKAAGEPAAPPRVDPPKPSSKPGGSQPIGPDQPIAPEKSR